MRASSSSDRLMPSSSSKEATSSSGSGVSISVSGAVSVSGEVSRGSVLMPPAVGGERASRCDGSGRETPISPLLPIAPHRLPTGSPPTFRRSDRVSPTSLLSNYILMKKEICMYRGGEGIGSPSPHMYPCFRRDMGIVGEMASDLHVYRSQRWGDGGER